MRKMVPLWIPLLFFTETLQVMCVLLQASRGRCRPVHRWLFNTGEEGVTQVAVKSAHLSVSCKNSKTY